MLTSPSILSVMTKLNKVSREIGSMQKDSEVDAGKYKYNYINLNSLLEKIIPYCEAENLSVVVLPESLNGVGLLATCLDTGEFIHTSTQGKPESSKLQAQGSIITYLTRYTLMGLFNIKAYDDDDGHSANKEVLTLGHDKFKTLIQDVKDGKTTIAELEELYTVTELFKKRVK